MRRNLKPVFFTCRWLAFYPWNLLSLTGYVIILIILYHFSWYSVYPFNLFHADIFKDVVYIFICGQYNWFLNLSDSSHNWSLYGHISAVLLLILLIHVVFVSLCESYNWLPLKMYLYGVLKASVACSILQNWFSFVSARILETL